MIEKYINIFIFACIGFSILFLLPQISINRKKSIHNKLVEPKLCDTIIIIFKVLLTILFKEYSLC